MNLPSAANVLRVAILFCSITAVCSAEDAEGELSLKLHDRPWSGAPLPIRYLYSLKPDCSSNDIPSMKVLDPPTHGSIEIQHIDAFPAYLNNSQRHVCNQRKSPMIGATYTPEQNFVGTDRFVLVGEFGAGRSSFRGFSVTIEASHDNTAAGSSTSDQAARSRTVSVVEYTLPRMDPAKPLKIGVAYYPRESLRANEEGRCVVSVRVGKDGWLKNASIQESTGYPALDKACLSGVEGGHLIPATEDGLPIEKQIALPIVWAHNH